MKNFARCTTSYLLVATLLVLMTPLAPYFAITAASNTSRQDETQKKYKIKSGPEVTARVKALKEGNKQVRKALQSFEVRGHKPKIEEAWSLTSTLPASKTAHANPDKSFDLMQKASFMPQDVISGGGIEAIFVPTLSTDTDWQGTVIATRYDEYGNFIEQYVADSAFIKQNSYENPWRGVFEVSFEGDNEWLESDPALGMITDSNFYFGTPIQEQPNLRNQQLELQMQASHSRGVTYKPASFKSSAPQMSGGYGTLPRPYQSPTRPFSPNTVRYYVNVAAGCTGVAVGTGLLTNPFSWYAFGVGCTVVLISQLPKLFGR